MHLYRLQGQPVGLGETQPVKEIPILGYTDVCMILVILLGVPCHCVLQVTMYIFYDYPIRLDRLMSVGNLNTAITILNEVNACFEPSAVTPEVVKGIWK